MTRPGGAETTSDSAPTSMRWSLPLQAHRCLQSDRASDISELDGGMPTIMARFAQFLCRRAPFPGPDLRYGEAPAIHTAC